MTLLMFLALVSLFLLHEVTNCIAFHSHTYSDKILLGSAYRTLNTSDWLLCIDACSSDSNCASYNYDGDLCELNECGLDRNCDGEMALIYSQGHVFQQLRENEVCSYGFVIL